MSRTATTINIDAMPEEMRTRVKRMKQLEQDWKMEHDIFNIQLHQHFGVETEFAATAAERKRKHPIEQTLEERRHFIDRARDPRQCVSVLKLRKIDTLDPIDTILPTPASLQTHIGDNMRAYQMNLQAQRLFEVSDDEASDTNVVEARTLEDGEIDNELL